MNEEVQFVLDETKESMVSTIEHLDKELVKIRAGKANPHLLDGIMVNYYGTETPLSRVANISTSDARTLTVQPWEKNLMEAIEKAILKANIGLTPINSGEIIRLNIPPLTEERRKILVKQVKNLGENSKVGIRTKRRETNDEIKKLKKQGLEEDEAKHAEDEVQKITDKYILKVDELINAKEKEIMTV